MPARYVYYGRTLFGRSSFLLEAVSRAAFSGIGKHCRLSSYLFGFLSLIILDLRLRDEPRRKAKLAPKL